jgi:hypothetical protein
MTEGPKAMRGKVKVRGDLVLAYGIPAMFPLKEKASTN